MACNCELYRFEQTFEFITKTFFSALRIFFLPLSEMDDLFSEAGDDKFSELGKQVCRMGLYLKANNCPANLQPQLKELDDLLVHASLCREDLVLGEDFVARCPYPKCYNGQVCYRHIYFCTERGCRLCNSMLELVKFHAGQCMAPNCMVPRCSELKKKKLRKEKKLRKREERIRRLRQKERDLKRIYDLPILELQRAVATAAARKLSVKDGQGDQSNQDDVNKLLGDPSVVSTRSSKMEEDREQKEEKK